MKKIIILLIVFLLSACTSQKISEGNLTSALDNTLDSIDTRYNFRTNNKSTYFSYYLPSDCQEMENSENASIIYFLNSKIVMNLNISSIINNKFYKDSVFDDEGFFNKDNVIYFKDGIFSKNNGVTSKFFIKVYKDNDIYLIQLKTNELNFYANTNINEIIEVINHIFLMAKTVEVDNTSIIAHYSAKEVIDYEKKQIDLFDYVNPSEGYLTDLINSSNGVITNEQENLTPNQETTESIDEEMNEEDSDEIEENDQE